MAEEKKFVYDSDTDSLIISHKKQQDHVRGSVDIQNVILDFTNTGKLVGLEIRHFSEFLKEFDIADAINEIGSATFSVKYAPNGIVIWLYIKFAQKAEQRLPLYVSTETSQLAVAT